MNEQVKKFEEWWGKIADESFPTNHVELKNLCKNAFEEGIVLGVMVFADSMVESAKELMEKQN